MTCKDCEFTSQPSTTLRCRNHGIFVMAESVVCNEFKPKPMTNADRIRAMTDAELEEWIVNKVTAGWCPRKASECISNCKMCWTYWLTQEARK